MGLKHFRYKLNEKRMSLLAAQQAIQSLIKLKHNHLHKRRAKITNWMHRMRNFGMSLHYVAVKKCSSRLV